MSAFFHEELHRGRELLDRLRAFAITICGAGALGGQIAESLARTGCGRIKLIDHDRIEERNLSTQPYQRADIGAFKASILAHSLYRALGTRVQAECKTLDARTVARLLGGSALVVDAFDNSVSRGWVHDWCARTDTPCIHAGLADAYGEVVWNAVYRVPSAVQDDICDYPLARNLVLLTTAVACEAILSFIATAQQRSYSITLDDFAIRPWAD
ncbi:MAG: ThiF family adenylyltransferase [Gammaproteobacteria bacterium]|nr:ThiF family adenylyltransferase [Gammaproteobacteria bacterium]MCP5425419.1 ThiF family adenylyltransferase [Gammaproteobacteria bacterium]MCP5459768.1 ThiF family adenylyltransferase [Gammaproteobacteria bacterium]